MADRTVRRGYVDGGGGQVHYRICAGARGCDEGGRTELAPLLMLHPTPKSGWIYEALLQRMAAGGRVVIAPDTPGYGASDALSTAATIPAYADAMFALIDALQGEGRIGPGPVDVLGYHTGSVTACEMAIARPAAVRRLMLFSLPMYDAAERAAKLAALGDWPRPSTDGSHLTRMWDVVGKLCDPRVNAEWRHRSVAENLRAHDTAAGYGAVYGYDLYAALPCITQPVLLANAGDDLFERTLLAKPLIADMSYRKWPGIAHGMFDLDTDMIADALEGFLR